MPTMSNTALILPADLSWGEKKPIILQRTKQNAHKLSLMLMTVHKDDQ